MRMGIERRKVGLGEFCFEIETLAIGFNFNHKLNFWNLSKKYFAANKNSLQKADFEKSTVFWKFILGSSTTILKPSWKGVM